MVTNIFKSMVPGQISDQEFCICYITKFLPHFCKQVIVTIYPGRNDLEITQLYDDHETRKDRARTQTKGSLPPKPNFPVLSLVIVL